MSVLAETLGGMEIVIGIIAALVGLVAGWALASTRLTERVSRAEVAAADARARLDAERQTGAERVAALQDDQRRLAEQFKALASDALKANSEQFMAVAEERLKRSQEAGDADLARREEAVKRLVEPLTQTLNLVKAEVTTAE